MKANRRTGRGTETALHNTTDSDTVTEAIHRYPAPATQTDVGREQQLEAHHEAVDTGAQKGQRRPHH